MMVIGKGNSYKDIKANEKRNLDREVNLTQVNENMRKRTNELFNNIKDKYTDFFTKYSNQELLVEDFNKKVKNFRFSDLSYLDDLSGDVLTNELKVQEEYVNELEMDSIKFKLLMNVVEKMQIKAGILNSEIEKDMELYAETYYDLKGYVDGTITDNTQDVEKLEQDFKSLEVKELKNLSGGLEAALKQNEEERIISDRYEKEMMANVQTYLDFGDSVLKWVEELERDPHGDLDNDGKY